MVVDFEEGLFSHSSDQAPCSIAVAVLVFLLLTHQVIVHLLLVRIVDQFFRLLALFKRLLEIIRQCLYLEVDRVEDLVKIRQFDHKLFGLRFSVQRSKSRHFQALDVTPSPRHGFILLL